MWHQLLLKNFWFAQPEFFLTKSDKVLTFWFVGLLVLGLILWIATYFTSNPVKMKVLSRFFHLFLTIGLLGLAWAGIRFENTPIFSLRSWAGLIFLIGLVWLGFIVKYLIFNFRKELKGFEQEQIKMRYMPSRR